MHLPSLSTVASWLKTWQPAILLGVLTCGAYGLVLYGFGIIAGPIQEDEGWSSALVNAAFMGSYLLGAAASLVSGRVLDVLGPRLVLWSGLVVGTIFLMAASYVGNVWLFIVFWTLGGAVTIAGLFYNVTMPIAARLYPQRQTAAMTVLVTTGGFSSVIFMPLTGLFTEEFGWRWAVRILLVLAAALSLPAVLTVRRLPVIPPPEQPGQTSEQTTSVDRYGYASVGEALRSREVQVTIAMVVTSSFGLGALLNHFVPAATAAGLSLTASASLTGLRGFLSLPGRALIGPMATFMGLRPALGAGYFVMLLGTLCLLAAGPLWWIYLSAIIAGLVWGQTMPLQGLIASEVYGLRRLGTLMAIQTAAGNVALAIGPFAAGVLLDSVAGDYQPVLIAIAAMNALTFLLLVLLTRVRRRTLG
ncbi:MAG: MFS transporter [Chloroflexi bacterium]|nr:MFS transporter [Chloroflexota bacterium]MYD15628.1 MFS transporter [Chloroflexota bacterium]